MNDEYDFSNAEQGKFYIPVEDIQLPIYLDKDIVQYLNEKCLTTQESLQLLVNDLLRKDIEIAKRVLWGYYKPKLVGICNTDRNVWRPEQFTNRELRVYKPRHASVLWKGWIDKWCRVDNVFLPTTLKRQMLGFFSFSVSYG